MRIPHFSLFSGTANQKLANAVAAILDHPISPCAIERFPDGEMSIHLDEPVRGHPVFIIQPTSPPVTENLFQLLALIDACRRAAAGRITAIVPYFGYARADRRNARREPITASMVANILQTAGLNHLVTLDLHTAQIEGFFSIPVDNLTAARTLCDELKRRVVPGTVVVSPDEGRTKLASQYAERLGADVAVLQKYRISASETKTIRVIGEVSGRPCVIIDDMITTGGTFTQATKVLLQAGAQPDITVAASHGLLLDGALSQLYQPAVREVIVTDSIDSNHNNAPHITRVTIAPLLAAAIQRLVARESISDLFL